MTNQQAPQGQQPDSATDYADNGHSRGGKIGQWWSRGSRTQKILVLVGALALVLAILVSVFGGGDDEKPASMESYSPPVVEGNDTVPSEQADEPQRDTRPTVQPREDQSEESDTPDIPQDNSNDARVTRATYVLDDVVNDPEMSLGGFDAINQRLQQQAALTADGTIRDTYQMLEYLAGSNAFASRASQPRIVDNTDGTYSIEYDVSGAVAPTKRGDSGDRLRKDIGNQMEQALFAGVSVPVTFTIDLNGGTVSTDTTRWW